jgi:hypothetical protein
MRADALRRRAIGVPQMPDQRIGHPLRRRPVAPVRRGAQHHAAEIFVHHPCPALGNGDARVLLLDDVVGLGVAGTLPAPDQTGRRRGQGEGKAAIVAFIDNDAAGKGHRIAALVAHPGRSVAGVKIRPACAIAHHQRVGFAHRQAGVVHVDGEVGAPFPKVGKRGEAWIVGRRRRDQVRCGGGDDRRRHGRDAGRRRNTCASRGWLTCCWRQRRLAGRGPASAKCQPGQRSDEEECPFAGQGCQSSRKLCSFRED